MEVWHDTIAMDEKRKPIRSGDLGVYNIRKARVSFKALNIGVDLMTKVEVKTCKVWETLQVYYIETQSTFQSSQ